MGYQSKKSVENLDSMFIYLGGLFGLVVFAIAIRFFKERFKFVKIVYDYLAKLVFWNMFLRMFLEGYMEYAITSLMNVYEVRQPFKIIDIFSLNGIQEVKHSLQCSH